MCLGRCGKHPLRIRSILELVHHPRSILVHETVTVMGDSRRVRPFSFAARALPFYGVVWLHGRPLVVSCATGISR
eukprot:scaffold25_cov342-Pavlova_lutheri.AAC.53